ncbi:MAG: T9SS type A sorting domain-containing protein [Crocinitomicaceae bacterium]
MKTLLLILSITFLSNVSFSNIVYVDNFDAVYIGGVTPLDIDGNGSSDYNIGFSGTNSIYFSGVNNTSNSNTVQRDTATVVGVVHYPVDCTGDTLNTFTSQWWAISHIWLDNYTMMSVGNHKQGFRLMKTNPANGLPGYLYGYIDYSLTSSNDVIIHGWYYEDNFSVPIIANTLLDYPFDSNCIYYDTTDVTVYDTTNINVYDTTFVTTNVTVYDTINVTIYDTTNITVTDTLFIDINNVGTPTINLTTIKVYPNPTNDQITIDNGDFALLNNYEIKITNSLGQLMFSSLINQQTFVVDISTLGSVGLYYLTLYDDSGTALTTRKIILN